MISLLISLIGVQLFSGDDPPKKTDTVSFARDEFWAVGDCLQQCKFSPDERLKISIIRSDTLEIVVDQIQWKFGGRAHCFYSLESKVRIRRYLEK